MEGEVKTKWSSQRDNDGEIHLLHSFFTCLEMIPITESEPIRDGEQVIWPIAQIV